MMKQAGDGRRRCGGLAAAWGDGRSRAEEDALLPCYPYSTRKVKVVKDCLK